MREFLKYSRNYINGITLGQIKRDNIITLTEEIHLLLIFIKWDLEIWLHKAADYISQWLH